MATPQIEQTLEASLNAMLGDSVKTACYSDDSEYKAIGSEESILANISSVKRAKHFKLGRLAARKALGNLNPEFSNFSLDKLPDGQILWPTDVCGSVAHSLEIAVAAVAKRTIYKSIGVDIEANREVLPKLLAKISVQSEQDCLHDIVPEKNNSSLLIFSAKEAIYKCLNSFTEKALTFFDAKLESAQKNSAGFYQLEFGMTSGLPRMTVLASQTDSITLAVCKLTS